jgi:hypothetical protein
MKSAQTDRQNGPIWCCAMTINQPPDRRLVDGLDVTIGDVGDARVVNRLALGQADACQLARADPAHNETPAATALFIGCNPECRYSAHLLNWSLRHVP